MQSVQSNPLPLIGLALGLWGRRAVAAALAGGLVYIVGKGAYEGGRLLEDLRPPIGGGITIATYVLGATVAYNIAKKGKIF